MTSNILEINMSFLWQIGIVLTLDSFPALSQSSRIKQTF